MCCSTRITPRSLPIKELLGKYELVEQIEDNGRTVIYRALDMDAQRPVLLKLLPPHRRNEENLARLQREAETLQTLDQPRIPRLYETGQIDDYRYIATEYVEGKSIAELLKGRRRAPFDLETTLVIAEKVAEVLDAAHAVGVIHGNLRPENILVTTDRDVRVLGFGEADLFAGVGEDIAPDQSRYMAPEQFEGKEPDHLADLYALGVILYEMLTGTPPFDASLRTTLMYSVLRGGTRPPSLLNPQLTEEIDAVILQAMARNKEERFSSGQALVEALRQAVSRLDLQARQQAPAAAPVRRTGSAPPPRATPVSELSGSPASTELPRYSPRRYRQRLQRRKSGLLQPWMLGAAFLIVLVIAAAALALSRTPLRLFAAPEPTATAKSTATRVPPTDTAAPTWTLTYTPLPTASPTATVTATSTVHPKKTLKAPGTSTPTQAPTRTKIAGASDGGN